ncbi:bifunctional [glutamine synthetase] adenylyltransferase/[glutamine synthetase]-adenylyl-L-tyrosine phosphorylase [Alkalicaulis satelles]|uniref:Bifunctional [glutamine synthetase] adenylyltransferase/[glutamine synthetase]-adenylyl-L-tyrosine phosphorylase n=1 Tax=Alkalicaulis satelles TaxID=2609175 RepID=A0A5M6ZLF2_9PROT|nr:bifunctional [glutamine synthetase] adenylyltransferase/[glutamine synthetase]-adenylyl-L-tyrosine phosphorylase [Alkalicaulis satelles]KAA5805160.1 bifunctional [glutamine synthetase] adenylyltransferase/[glutamine synthetase]-adenylyl-L-tyrosine phosphorylase [Alkalicaulis satelles]
MTAALPHRLSVTLPLIDAAGAARWRERIPESAYAPWEAAGEAREPGEQAGGAFLDAVFAAAPYLARIAARRPQTLQALGEQSPESVLARALDAARAAGALEDEADVLRALREAKADLHLTVALSDLAGAWPLEAVTRALSDFADVSVQASLAAAARLTGFEVSDPDNPVPGYFVLTLGKHGQRSLNFSSDIDLVILWEPETACAPQGKDAHKSFNRLAQKLAFLMQEVTADGYVFRVDLRLRPDPSSTPPAVSADMARRYFEAVGQNWERAAYAKARWCAGDRKMAEGFLKDLTPFIWRRALDFAAVEDIRALAKQIQAVGERSKVRAAGHDLKLGRGGIREIEFFAQVLQLAFGGRNPALRPAGTLDALKALSAEGLIEAGEVDALAHAYAVLRDAEHRVQMIEDAQSQTLPEADEARRAVAALSGEGDLAAFDARIRKTLQGVHALFSAQFEDGESLATQAGSLVLTGVEPTPDTLATLDKLGFEDPAMVWARLSGWAAGRARAARTERARRLFSRFAPRLVEAIAATGDPDAALARFAAFFEGLPSGVQVLSLLVNQPELARELIAILGLAPRLAELLARRPALIDVMLEPAFARPLKDDEPGLVAERFAALEGLAFEDSLNTARRIAREERLRIGAQLLIERATASEAGEAFAALADASVAAMARAAEAEMARRHGPAPGRWAVLGLGKLGGRELSADSDLDLMLVYDADAERSDGAKPLGAETWFVRFAQRLVSALSAPTEEGDLYPVDMALRPSGSHGPLAVRLSRFESYYASEEAWTWERMALTRARVVAEAGLGEALEAAVSAAIARPAASESIRADAADMRARLARDKPARSSWDLKLREGGMIEIEFIAQTAQLIARARFDPGTGPALRQLAGAGALERADVETLIAAHEDYAAVTQLIRAAHGGGFDPSRASAPFARRLARSAGCDTLDGLAERLNSHGERVHSLFVHLIGRV